MRASIVVLTYNHLEDGTRPCLESIFRNTPAEDFELIVVDNSSKDGTPDFLNELKKSHSNVKVILNQSNKGYAGGNNDGIKVAKGDFIILLNNDTLVTPGWLDRLLYPFIKDPSIGLVGPITNSAGNEQMVIIPNLVESNHEKLSEEYVSKNKDYYFETEKLGFFCVAISRKVIDKIGILDEKFGIGMFEDDDYCLRAKRAGFKLVVDEGCFIYHKGSLSFKKMAEEEYREIFRKNREYFTRKHGEEWLFNQITMAFFKQMEREVLRLSNDPEFNAPEIDRIKVRLLGFKYLIENSMNIERNTNKSGEGTDFKEKEGRRAFRLFKDEFIKGDRSSRRIFLDRIKRKIS